MHTILMIIPEFVVSTPAKVSSTISMTTRVKYKLKNGPNVSKKIIVDIIGIFTILADKR